MEVIYLGKAALPEFHKPVVAIGAFDGFHKGHQKLLSRLLDSARELGGQSVLLTFYPHPRLVLDPADRQFALLSTPDEKIALLEQTGLDYLVIAPFDYSFSMMLPGEYVEEFLISRFRPYKLLAGEDHRFGRNGSGDGKVLTDYALQGHFLFEEVSHHRHQGLPVSSTRIRNLISESRIEEANELLGRAYSFTGSVIPGDRVGRELGYRTANLTLKGDSKLLPPNGSYAVFCHLGGTSYEAMLYIGTRETIDRNSSRRSIEVHILDFNQDVYGQEMIVDLVSFLREDMVFQSKAELVKNIRLDEKNTRKALLKERLRTTTASPRVAVVLLNYNGQKLLEKFLPGLCKHLPTGSKLYVIDNGSSDNSIVYLQHYFPEVAVIKLLNNYGFASGYNKGIAQIDADYFALINSDVHVTSDWVTPLTDIMRNDPLVFAIQPKIKALNSQEYFEYAGGAGGFVDLLRYPFCRGRIIDLIERDQGQYDGTEEVFWASGAAMIVKGVVFKALGGFDDDYFAHQEEIDLCWRMKRLGGKILSSSDSEVLHLGGGTLDYDHPRKVYLNFRNNLSTLFKNENWINLLYIIPMRLVLDMMIALSYLLKGRWQVFYKIVQAYVVSIINTLYLIHKKTHTDQLMSELRIGPFRPKGMLRSSIFLQFYIAGNKLFSRIPTQYFR
jgi:riboflavin kinase/FMN adenylyltransferase